MIHLVDVKELRGIIAREGLSQAKVAKHLGITPKTFYLKMQSGVFGSDEIERMILLLNIQEPAKIFFAML